MSTEHQPIPVQGYKPQSQETVDLVNEGKMLEERLLRYFAKIHEQCIDGVADRAEQGERARALALGKTHLQTAMMWSARSIFNPGRAKLPEDT